MENSTYVWLPDATSPSKTLKISIGTYTMKHAIARDTKIGATKKVSLDLSVPPAKKIEPTPTPSYYLVAEGHSIEELRITKPTNIIGRDPTCDLILHNPQVSRRHCLLDIQVRGIYIRDLGSTNGIMINGIPASEGFITCDDQLMFGTFLLRVHKQ